MNSKEMPEPCVQRLEVMARLCLPGVHAGILVYTPDELKRMVGDVNLFILRALQEGKLVYEAHP